MLYLDTSLPIKPFSGDQPDSSYDGSYGVVLGHRGRNGPEHLLKVPYRFNCEPRLRSGLHLDLTISRALERPPKIVTEFEDKLFLIISSRLTTEANHLGNIRVPRGQKLRLVTRAVGPPGTGRSETVVLEAKKGDAFYVNWNCLNGTEATDCFYYVAELDQIFICPRSDIPGLCLQYELVLPFTVKPSADPLVSCLDLHEWFKL